MAVFESNTEVKGFEASFIPGINTMKFKEAKWVEGVAKASGNPWEGLDIVFDSTLVEGKTTNIRLMPVIKWPPKDDSENEVKKAEGTYKSNLTNFGNIVANLLGVILGKDGVKIGTETSSFKEDMQQLAKLLNAKAGVEVKGLLQYKEEKDGKVFLKLTDRAPIICAAKWTDEEIELNNLLGIKWARENGKLVKNTPKPTSTGGLPTGNATGAKEDLF